MKTQEEWEKSRCPFNVAPYCITTECGAYSTFESETQAAKFEYKELPKGNNPNGFWNFGGKWEICSQKTESEEKSQHVPGGEYEPDTTEYWTEYTTIVTWRRLIESAAYKEYGRCRRMND